MIAVLSAMEKELQATIDYMDGFEIESPSPWKLYRGAIGDKEVVAGCSGVGKVLSGIACQRLIDTYEIECVIYCGIAGALNPGYEIGDVVVARDCIQHDFDVTQQGFALGEIPFDNIRSIPCDPGLTDVALSRRDSTRNIYSGRILTGDSFITDDTKARQLRQVLGGDAVEMEGAGAGIAAYLNKIPFLLFRIISDRSDGKLSKQFDAILKDASVVIRDMVIHVLASRC